MARTLWLQLTLCWCALASSSAARADSTRIMMVSDASVPDDLVSGAKDVLSSNGTLVDPGPYNGAARGQHLSPTSEAALTKIGPKVKVKLIVSLEVARGKLVVTFRDGSSGSSISETKLAARGKHPKMTARSSKKLSTATRNALAKLGGHAVSEPEERDDDMDEPEAAPTPPARPTPPVQASRPAPPPAAAATQASEPWNDNQNEQGEEQSAEGRENEEPAAPETPTDPADTFHVRLTLGGGAGARQLTAPTRSGAVDANTGFGVPALELGANAQVVVGGQWILSGEVVYRTIFGLHALQTQLDGSTASSSMSSHSVMLGVAPGYRFGPKNSVDLRVFLGYAFRTLSSSVPSLPGGSVSGVVIRPELRIPIASGALTLRLAPELILLLGSDAILPGSVAGLSGVGVSIGGEFTLDVRLAEFISLGVEYRESRASVSSAWNISMFDLERYVLGRITLLL